MIQHSFIYPPRSGGGVVETHSCAYCENLHLEHDLGTDGGGIMNKGWPPPQVRGGGGGDPFLRHWENVHVEHDLGADGGAVL